MASDPKFASTPRFEMVRINALNTNHDGTVVSSTPAILITGVAAGTKVFSITAVAEVTTTAGMLRIWSTLDATPTWRLYDEIPILANTVSATVPGIRIYKTYPDLILRSAIHSIGVSMEKAEAIVCHAAAGDLT